MKKNIKQTFEFTKRNLIGLALLLPFFAMFSIDFVSRILQHNFASPNPSLISAVSHTIFYSPPVLFAWVILFPLLAVFLNLVPVIKGINQIRRMRKSLFSPEFLSEHFMGILVFGIAAMFLGIIVLHDFAPCVLTGILTKGFRELVPLVNYCKSA